jgi:hypothetical protein
MASFAFFGLKFLDPEKKAKCAEKETENSLGCVIAESGNFRFQRAQKELSGSALRIN